MRFAVRREHFDNQIRPLYMAHLRKPAKFNTSHVLSAERRRIEW
jgi:hypothetical protein